MNTLIMLAITLFATFVALVPFWFYLGVVRLLEPQGFWQKLFTVGFGIYFLGLMQLILLALLIVFLLALWSK